MMRIAKYIANAGICSRRDAEKLILSGKVYINDILCDKPNVNVNTNDKISIIFVFRYWNITSKIIKITTNNLIFDFINWKNIFDKSFEFIFIYNCIVIILIKYIIIDKNINTNPI